MWAFVDERTCRRAAVLKHFGDPDVPHADVPCCDVCDPSLIPANPLRRARAAAAGGAPVAAGDLDEAIRYVAEHARPAVGRTRVVEILRGSRSKAVLKHAYDGLPVYCTFDHLPKDVVLDRVDAMLESGALRSSGGPYPVLSAGPVAEAA